MIGQLVSHYKILEKLGAGGMGEVYLAQDTELDRKVALKFLPPHYTEDPEINAPFKREAKAAAALNHPNIITIHQIGEHEGKAFIAMEYVEGQSLRDMMDSLAKVPNLRKVLDLASQICEGLSEAHGAGIVHRDIKPDNILLDANGRVKIADFGVAKARGRTKLTEEGSTLGTLAYMSPEQISGEEVDQRSDIWSVGVVLYEMITRRTPFEGEYDAAVSYSIIHEEPEPLARYKTGVSEDLQRIIDKALRKEPDTRYQSAVDLLADLKELRQEPATKSISPPAKTRVGFGKMLLGGMAAVALVLIYALISGFLDSKSKSDKKMVAVLPFKNLGPAEQEYFADGMTEEIISRLAGIRALGVISRTSIIQYKQTDKTLQEIGAELEVDYVLEGTVRWQPMADGPSRVRVTPQLIRVSDDTHLWTDRYNAVLTDIFQVQADIAERVSAVLNVAVLASERRSLERIPTHNLKAYDTFLRGNDYFNRGQEISSEPDFRRALEMYQKAVGLDSAFALAYARISLAHHWMYFFLLDHSEERLAKEKAADRASRLDPDLPEAHLALGYHYANRLAHELAQKEFAMALEQQPNNSEIYLAIGHTRWMQGDFEQALPNFKKAAQLHPRHGMIPCFVGGTYMMLQDFPEAARFHDRAISLIPNRSCPYYCKAMINLRWQGDLQKARAVLEEASQKVDLEQLPSILFPWVLLDLIEGKYAAALNRLTSTSSETFEWDHYYVPKALLFAQIYGLMNRPQLEQAYYDSARILLETTLQERPEDSRLHSSLGIAYAGLGRKQEAIREGKLATELLPAARDAFRGPARLESLARIYVMVGEYDAAIDQLETLLPMPRGARDPLLAFDPIWAPLRDHPRFQKLLENRI